MASRTSLQFPQFDSLIGPDGIATRMFQNWANGVANAIAAGNAFLVLTSLGPAGNGGDDTAIFQSAINQVSQAGGGVIFIPAGSYRVTSVSVPRGSAPVTFLGAGESTVINAIGGLAQGIGVFDISSSNVTFTDLVIDGGVTVPVGLLYNGGFSTSLGANDPMAPVLTTNTSIWAHGPASNLRFQNIRISHSGGYAILLDAMLGTISDVQVLDSRFSNNRPNLFGIAAGQENYGSWTGGIYLNGDGRNVGAGQICQNVVVQNCSFSRNTGNCFWSHVYGFAELHQNLRAVSNSFEDFGLDGILIGGVIGGAVSDNVLHRVGYITLTDTDRPVPKWLPNANATAIDSSGVVMGVNYQGNSITSICGGAIDMDGHSDSSVSLNLVRIPLPGDPDYDEDSIAISGLGGGPSTAYGLNMGNTQNTPFGATNVTITGNTLLNLQAGSIRLYSARGCLVIGNNIVSPPVPLTPPISMGPQGAGPNQACTGNVIKHNRFSYSPAGAAPFVFEDSAYGVFTAGMVNSVFGNCPIIGNGNASEFLKDPNSGSITYAQTVWWP